MTLRDAEEVAREIVRRAWHLSMDDDQVAAAITAALNDRAREMREVCAGVADEREYKARRLKRKMTNAGQPNRAHEAAGRASGLRALANAIRSIPIGDEAEDVTGSRPSPNTDTGE